MQGFILRRSLNHLNATIEDELLVLDPASGQFHLLSHSAGLVYESVDGTSTAAGIAGSLSHTLGLSVDQLIGDVQDAVRSMVNQGLLIADDPSSDTAGLPRLHVEPSRPADPRAPLRLLDRSAEIGPVLAGAARVSVRSHLPGVNDLLAEPLALLPRPSGTDPAHAILSVTDPGDTGPFEIHENGTTVASAVSVHEAAEAVLATCNRLATTEPAGTVRIHGGVVSKNDKAVVLCGESGAGKSTLTAALVQHGWLYLTDEVAVIDPATWLVTPYPKWVDLSNTSLQLLGLDEHPAIGPTGAKHHVPPQALGDIGGAAPVAAIVMLTSGQPKAAPRRLGPSEAVEAMLGNVFATTWDHPNGLQALVDLCTATTVVQMTRRPLVEMVALVDDLVRTARRPPG